MQQQIYDIKTILDPPTFLLCDFRRFLLFIVILPYLHSIRSLMAPSHPVLDLEPNERKETAVKETKECKSPTCSQNEGQFGFFHEEWRQRLPTPIVLIKGSMKAVVPAPAKHR